MSWLEQWIKEQVVDNSGVIPESRWNQREGAFYLNSPAGLIRFKPKTDRDLSKFRDRYINRFEVLKGLEGSKMIEGYFLLYDEIRACERVKYRANVRTRLKARVCNLNPFI